MFYRSLPSVSSRFASSRSAPRRSRLAGALTAVALALPLIGAAGGGTATAQSVDDAALAAPLQALEESDAFGHHVTDAVNGVNGPPGAPGPPAPVNTEVNCQPTPAHPRPVILVHGTFDNGPNTMPRLGGPLQQQGFCVIAPTFGAYAANPGRGGLDSIVGASGPQLASVIDQVRAETGAAQVDLVGYSQGAAIAGYTTKMLRPGAVARVVSVGGYWGADNSGMVPDDLPTEIAGAGLWAVNLRGLAELAPNSPMVAAWNGLERSPYLPGVEYTLIATRGDAVMPPELSFVPGPGVRTLVSEDVCGGGPTSHGEMAVDWRTHALMAGALGGAGGC